MTTISKAKIKDSQKIRKLEQKIWKEQSVTGKYEADDLIRFGYVFTAKDKNKIIGAILAMKTPNNSIYVVDWVVDKKYQKRGIGKKLYKKLIDSVHNAPIFTLLSSTDKIINIHKKMGFKIQKKIKDPYGIGEKGYRFLVKKSN